MKILGIDTSSPLNSIGIIDGDRILADFSWEAKGDTLQRIIQLIDSVLTKEGMAVSDIEGLAVGIGPGSWTGVRIGVTVSKILAYATNKPICGISSLDSLAFQAKDNPTLICPVIDAGKDAIYSAFYRSHDGIASRVSEYYSGDIKGLLDMIREPSLFLGNEVRPYRQIITEKLGSLASYEDELDDIQRGPRIAFLALSRLKKRGADNTLSLSPMYVKEYVAKTLRSKRLEGDC